MLAHLDSMLLRARATLLPVWARRISRNFMLTAPLLWRSCLLPLLALSMIACFVAWHVGDGWKVTPATAWSEDETDAVVGYVELVLVLMGCVWYLYSTRFSTPLLRWREQVSIWVYSLVAMSAIILPAQVFREGLNGSISRAMTAAELHPYVALQNETNSWCYPVSKSVYKSDLRFVSRRSTELQDLVERVTNQMDLIDPLVGAWGYRVVWEGPISVNVNLLLQKHRSKQELCLGFSNGSSSEQLAARIFNVQRLQQSATLGDRVERFGKSLVPWIGVFVLIALAVAQGSSLSWYSRSRRFLESALKIPSEGLIARLGRHLDSTDRALLLSHPKVWATGVHRFLLHATGLGLIAYWLIFSFVHHDSENSNFLARSLGNFLGTVLLLLVFVSGSLIWLVRYRVRQVVAFSNNEIRSLIGAFAAATIPLPVLAACVMFGINSTSLDWEVVPLAMMVGMVLSLPILSAALVANFAGLGTAMAGLALSLGLSGLWLLPDHFESSWAFALPTVWLALHIGVVARAARPLSRHLRRTAVFLIATAGTVVSQVGLLLALLIANKMMSGYSGPVQLVAALSAIVAIVAFTFLWLILPSVRLLATAAYLPGDY